jgi:hypothetical protein
MKKKTEGIIEDTVEINAKWNDNNGKDTIRELVIYEVVYLKTKSVGILGLSETNLKRKGTSKFLTIMPLSDMEKLHKQLGKTIKKIKEKEKNP